MRAPQTSAFRWDTGADVLQHELLAERAAALGRGELRVKAALKDLHAHDGDPELREALLREAADAVWCFFIQREICGLRDQSAVIAEHAIPREVLSRLGAR